MLTIHYLFIVFFSLLIFLQPVLAQSVVWDEKTKSWVSTTATAPAPTPQPQPQQQPAPAPTVIQTVPTSAPNAAVDLGTLATVITPIIGGIAAIFMKNKKDMEKKDEQVKEETIKAIEQAILPKLKQITPVAEQTAKQSVQLNQLAEELYKVMAEKANDIHDKPEIQQQKLIEDAVRSRIVAEQTKQQSGIGSMFWDDVKKEWVSK